MSVKLRLRRMGRKKAPVYALVAADARSPRDGRYIEDLGRYEPLGEVTRVALNEDRVLYWLRQGAQPSETANSLLHKEGFLLRLHLERKGKTSEEVIQAVEEFRTRRAGAAGTVATAAERRREALEAERKAAAEAAKEAAEKRQKREAELEKQRQAGDDAARAARAEPPAGEAEGAGVETAAEADAEPTATAEAEEGVVEGAMVEEPAAEEPAAEAEEAAVEEPAEEPAAEEPVVEEPVAEEPAVEEPALEEPAVEEPAVEEPVAEAPAVEEPVAEAPAVQEPVAEAPAVEEPAVEESVAEAPAADKLERLHGVGKKYAEALRGAGITTYAALAEADVATLRAAISGGSEGSDAIANEETWPAQARLLAAGDDAGFDALVAELKA